MTTKREIYVINPDKRKKKTSAKKRKATNMPKRKKRRVRRSPARKRVRRNPSRARRVTRKAGSRARKSIAGLNFGKVFKDMPAVQFGMWSTKAVAKLMGETASETDPESWNYMSYVKGALGGTGAAILANMVKPGSGQKALEGSLNYLLFKIIQNELVVRSEFAQEHFGEYQPDEYLMTGDENWYLGQNGQYYPTDEQYRLPEGSYGSALQPVNELGDVLVPPGRLGGIKDNYKKAYFQQV